MSASAPSVRRVTRACGPLTLAVLVVGPARVHAQMAPAALPVGAARVSLVGGALADPVHYWSVTGEYAPFVSSRWQLGVAPGYAGTSAPGFTTIHQLAVAVLANYFVPLGHATHGYVGGSASRAGSIGATSNYAVNSYGVQAGVLRFVAPAAAVRAEAQWRRDDRYAGAVTSVQLTLDPYVGGQPSRAVRWTPPGAGAVDADLRLFGQLHPGQWYTARIAAAPFLTRWAQLGAAYDGSYTPSSGFTSHAVRGFGRGYLPLAGRTAPFAEGFGTWTASSGPGSDGLSTYGVAGGVRRYLSANAAADLGLNWARAAVVRFGDGERYRSPDQLRLQLGLVTQLRRGRSAE